MNFRFLFHLSAVIFSAILISCSGNKSATLSHAPVKSDTVKHAAPAALPFTYRFRFVALGSETKPHDEISIDSNGQMTFDTHQHFKDGSWKSPRGLAYLEPRDEDTLLTFIKQDQLYSIDESDVTPQCPDGDQYTIRIIRSDLKKELSIRTNTCAAEFNLLTGQMRKTFPAFLAFMDRIRYRYRPLFTD